MISFDDLPPGAGEGRSLHNISQEEVVLMIMNVGMLVFGIFDSVVAFFLVYNMIKAKLGGDTKKLARIVSAIVATITASVYFAVIVWFNTNLYTVSFEAKMVVYLAPIVLAVLMGVLVWLSQPPKKTEAPAPDSAEPEAETSTSK